MSGQARETPPRPDRLTAGEFVRLRRRAAKMTQEGLARAMTGIGEPTLRKQVSEWEVEVKMPSARKLLAVLEATGGSVAEALGATGGGIPMSDVAARRRIHLLEREIVKLRRHLTADIA